MISKIKRLIATTSAALLLVLGSTPAIAMAVDGNPDAQIQGNACQGSTLDLSNTADSKTCTDVTKETGTQANSTVASIINVFSIIVGIVSVIMIIYGGFRYITSGGESGHITTAKNTILYAIIGLVIVALAQFIVKFVLSKAVT